MDDPWDTRYVLSLVKGIIADLAFIFCFVMIYTIYNLTINNKIVLPITILINPYFLINNFIVLSIFITYFVYRSKQII